jgi:hypothetical protein
MDEGYADYLAKTEQWEKLKSYDAAAYHRLHAEHTKSLRDINNRISPPTPQAVLKHAHLLFEHLENKMSYKIDRLAEGDKDLWQALNLMKIEIHRQQKTIQRQQREIDELRRRP